MVVKDSNVIVLDQDLDGTGDVVRVHMLEGVLQSVPHKRDYDLLDPRRQFVSVLSEGSRNDEGTPSACLEFSKVSQEELVHQGPQRLPLGRRRLRELIVHRVDKYDECLSVDLVNLALYDL